MKTEVPEALKADLPHTKWGKVLSSTPVVLAVVATMLAGLASSEMTAAQYERSLAAQLQSKAGDQWSFFQAKRLRSALQNNTLDLFSTGTPAPAFDAAALTRALAGTPLEATLATPAGVQTLEILRSGTLPKPPATTPLDPSVKVALDAVEHARNEAELAEPMTALKSDVLDRALRAARDDAAALDTLLQPINQTLAAVESEMDRGRIDPAVRRSLIAARLNYNARRYDAEARLNQAVANLYELQVRKANLSATRHHRRSQKFFYGMLAAQTGVIVSTLAIAARKRNLLWTLAAVAGAVAIIFALYVYLYV